MIDEKLVKRALDTQFPNAEPAPDVWNRIREAVPAASRVRRRFSRVAVASVCAAAILTGGVAAANPSKVQQLVDKMFRKTGIQLVEVTPEVREEWTKQQTDQNGEPVVSTFAPVDPAKVRELALPDMKLPTYLPPEVTIVQAIGKSSMSAFWWSNPPTHVPADRKAILVSFHTRVFGPGSKQGTSGPVTEVRDIKINGIDGSAFKDDKGWNLLWAMDNHQYEVVATGYDLDEAIKVAESLK